MIFNYGSGNVAAGSWKFKALTAKPEAVAKNTMIGIVITLPTNITVADEQPANPAANDVWFHIVNPEDSKVFSDGSVPIRCFGAYQYVSGAWTLLTAYYSYLGVWWELPGLPALGTPLSNCSWEQIDRIGKAGKAADYFCIGDTKSITLTTAEVVTLQIIGLAHDSLSAAGGGKAPITLGFSDCLNAVKMMNGTSTNVGSYAEMSLHTVLDETIFGTLPAELRAVAKTVNKLTGAGGTLTSLTTTQERLFLLSEVETTGTKVSATAPGEGTQYAFFTNGGARVKKIAGTAGTWWLRSPAGTSGGTFCVINASGSVTSLVAASSPGFGVAPALCV